MGSGGMPLTPFLPHSEQDSARDKQASKPSDNSELLSISVRFSMLLLEDLGWLKPPSRQLPHVCAIFLQWSEWTKESSLWIRPLFDRPQELV